MLWGWCFGDRFNYTPVRSSWGIRHETGKCVLGAATRSWKPSTMWDVIRHHHLLRCGMQRSPRAALLHLTQFSRAQAAAPLLGSDPPCQVGTPECLTTCLEARQNLSSLSRHPHQPPIQPPFPLGRASWHTPIQPSHPLHDPPHLFHRTSQFFGCGCSLSASFSD